MISRFVLLAILSVDVLILLFQSSVLSISAHEADLLYGEFSFIQLIEQFSFSLFGVNDFALRTPMIFLHILSALLLYRISQNYLKDERNRLWLLAIFILLPGVLSSALLVDSAGLHIFGLLLFLYVYENFSLKYTYPLLLLYSFIDGVFLYLFISLVVYSLYKKDKILFSLNILFAGLSFYLYGIDTQGSPQGHLVDTIGLYSAIFTPVIFVYIFYVLYRKFLSKEFTIAWFVATIPLVISLLLSFRQNINIEIFAPYLIIALPLAAQAFHSAYRVRLKMFRVRYKTIFALSALFLLINFVVVLFNRELYLIIENPQNHFARKMHIAKELSVELENRDISCIKTEDNMGNRLKFYGISYCEEHILKEQNLLNKETSNVTISYKFRPIYTASVTNINNK